MTTPYDENQVLGFCADCDAAYTGAGQPWNAAAGVWPARMQYDSASLGYPAARSKQLANLNAALGNTIPPGPIPPTPGPIEPRPPLPPFDPNSVDPDTGAFLPVYTSLREQPPAADVGWWRGDAWGVTVPNLPAVPGGADGPAQSRVLTYFLDRYGRNFEDTILKTHRDGCGYTHISLSPQDSFAFGTSEDDYVAMSVRCRAAGFHVHHLMRSKYYTRAKGAPRQVDDPTLQHLRERFRRPPIPAQYGADPDLSAPDALIERLLAEGAMQVETPAWEMNYWSPSTCRAMINHDSDLIGTRCEIALHFFPHYISWQENHLTPTDFWRDNYGRVDSVLYQDDPYWSAGMMAARSQDCLDRLAPGGIWRLRDSGRGHPIRFIRWETIATVQFNNDEDGDGRLGTEDQGNLKGYEGVNSPGLMTVSGFGNGARRPDGSPL